jgi:glycosyltransferase involved in cell wall biosynthesis
VTSNRSALPEVTGDAGVLVDPYEPQAICQAIADLLESNERRDDLARRGLDRARHFTWRQVAEQTVRVYRDVLGLPASAPSGSSRVVTAD